MAIQTTSNKNLFFIFLFLFASPCTIYHQDEELGLDIDETEELSLDEEPTLELDEPIVTEEKKATLEDKELSLDDEPLPDTPINKLLGELGDTISELLTNLLNNLTGTAQTFNPLKQLQEDLKQGIIRIPKIGLLKFSSPDETKITLPKGEEISDLKLVGTLYDTAGTTIKSINTGPFKLNKIHVLLSASSRVPRIFIDAVFFDHKAIIFQQITSSIEDMKFTLSFPDKPFKIGVGPINATITYFDLLLSEDEKILSTDAKLFKFPGVLPAHIKFDITEQIFKISTSDIPLMALVKKVIPPFRKLTFPTLNINITFQPVSLKFSGVADLSQVKMGLNTKGTKGKVSGSLGTNGVNFNLEIENVHLPFNRGTINKATIQLNTE